MNILFEIETERVKGIALHPTAPYVLIGCIDGFVQLYNYESRECLHVCEELGRPVNMRAVRAVCFHAAKPLFAAGGNDGVVRVYNYVEHTCVASLRLHADYVRSLSFHASRPLLASASDDMSVAITDYEAGKVLGVLSDVRCEHYMMGVAFAPADCFSRDDVIAAGNVHKNVALWTLESLEKHPSRQGYVERMLTVNAPPKLKSADLMLKGHTADVASVCFHPRRPLLASASDDGTIRLWAIDGAVFSAPREPWITKERVIEVAETIRCHGGKVTAVAFFSSGEMASVAEDGSCVVYDIDRHDVIARMFIKHRTIGKQLINEQFDNATFTNVVEQSRCWAVACHPAKRMMAIGHDYGFKVVEF